MKHYMQIETIRDWNMEAVFLAEDGSVDPGCTPNAIKLVFNNDPRHAGRCRKAFVLMEDLVRLRWTDIGFSLRDGNTDGWYIYIFRTRGMEGEGKDSVTVWHDGYPTFTAEFTHPDLRVEFLSELFKLVQKLQRGLLPAKKQPIDLPDDPMI